MQNALEVSGMPPEAPMQASDMQPQGGPMPGPAAPQGNPLQMGGGGPQRPQPQQMPAPSHVQTVAALHHFHAITSELEGLLKNPDLGRSSVKSAIIDGATKLVAERIISPADAVQQLGTVPDEPVQQKKWLQQQWLSANQAQNAILAHRQMAVQNGTAPPDDPNASYKPDDHMSTMQGVMSHYKGLGRG